MDSEDEFDMHDDNDDHFYSGDDDDDDDGGVAGYELIDNASDDSNDDDRHRDQQSYNVLTEDDIRLRQEEDITKTSTVLCIRKAEASILLRHFEWSVSKVQDEWFTNEEKVRKTVGLPEKPVIEYRITEGFLCRICEETYPSEEMLAAACGHPFCYTCWEVYIGTQINEGPGCLILRCPAIRPDNRGCDAVVSRDMINALACNEDREKYSRYFIRSYIEDNRKIKGCPAPGCDYAIDFIVGSGSYDVTCRCAYSFCWSCTVEPHRPVRCSTVEKWMSKNSVESENIKWILANAKPCPKCRRPIEKNQGCMHMTCTHCKFEFCWNCVDAWSEHGETTGGFYACNRYETAKQEGVYDHYDEAERLRMMAMNSAERYTHYYERWATNQSSWQKALTDLQQMQTVHLEKLSDIRGQPESQLKFITEAWLQIVECRRVLKWTYAYGYYLPEHKQQAKRQFFEYLQGEAEFWLERLHQCAEKELQVYFDEDVSPKGFIEFRTKLAGLTSATRNFFENLVRTLENDFSDVDIVGSSRHDFSDVDVVGSSRKMANSKSLGGASGKGRGERGKATTSRSSSSNRNVDDLSHWSCEHCTYVNVRSTNVCQMCEQRR